MRLAVLIALVPAAVGRALGLRVIVIRDGVVGDTAGLSGVPVVGLRALVVSRRSRRSGGRLLGQAAALAATLEVELVLGARVASIGASGRRSGLGRSRGRLGLAVLAVLVPAAVGRTIGLRLIIIRDGMTGNTDCLSGVPVVRLRALVVGRRSRRSGGRRVGQTAALAATLERELFLGAGAGATVGGKAPTAGAVLKGGS